MTWCSETFGEELLCGGQDEDHGRVKTQQVLADKKFVGIYFSAKHCIPCREFTPLLATVYDELVQHHPDDLEIVYVSSDQRASDFGDSLAQMPWKAIPFENQSTRQQLRDEYTTLVPWLVFLNGQGEFLTEDGRMIVSDALGKGDVEQIWHTLLALDDKSPTRS